LGAMARDDKEGAVWEEVERERAATEE
jgi:hypothetical protein